MKKFIASMLLICLFMAGCVSGAAHRYYLQEKLPPKNIEDVEVLREKPLRPHIVIADFQFSMARIRHVQKKAAEIGADAVIVTPTGGWYSHSETWAGEDRYLDTYSGLIGTAIKYEKEK